MVDKIVVVKITGQTFKDALENSVSKYPSFDGRWACVSGVKFKFDPEKVPGNRINIDDIVLLNGDILDLTKVYTLTAK